MHETAGLFFECGKIVIHLLDEAERRFIIKEAWIQLRAHFPGVHRNDQRFLYGVFLIEYFTVSSRSAVIIR